MIGFVAAMFALIAFFAVAFYAIKSIGKTSKGNR